MLSQLLFSAHIFQGSFLFWFDFGLLFLIFKLADVSVYLIIFSRPFFFFPLSTHKD